MFTFRILILSRTVLFKQNDSDPRMARVCALSGRHTVPCSLPAWCLTACALSTQVISQLRILGRSVTAGCKFDREIWSNELSPILNLWKKLNQVSHGRIEMFTSFPCALSPGPGAVLCYAVLCCLTPKSIHTGVPTQLGAICVHCSHLIQSLLVLGQWITLACFLYI